eukprot:CAMPEP_0118950136 /NCGR_PEP_ID=MMETSP1169-20130426/50843_1 /TAXON_ID=36882 /ORGANISM="Pyramimonas obovata, Strain CCMP722" /LENGTH=99 /DNA_ID=CAMNT_0006896913 /DNA_START=20 /DNA_END=317 /DNA_ORIENTATION=+
MIRVSNSNLLLLFHLSGGLQVIQKLRISDGGAALVHVDTSRRWSLLRAPVPDWAEGQHAHVQVEQVRGALQVGQKRRADRDAAPVLRMVHVQGRRVQRL